MPHLLRCITILFILFVPLFSHAEPSAREILEASGIRGGIVVVVGAKDPDLLTDIARSGPYLVHSLDSDAKTVQAAREYVRKKGLYGQVSIEELSATRLPYAENLVNLVVIRDAGCEIRDGEIARVLAPRGKLVAPESFRFQVSGFIPQTEGGLAAFRKPVPPDTDEWTHFLHGPGNNAVAQDEQVAPPRHLQWVSRPLWLRSHETPSGFQGQVMGGGRTFYIFDEGLIGIVDQRIPERWAIICRDAFNGKQLWRKPLPDWGWPKWTPERAGKDWTKMRAFRTKVPNQAQRRMVVDGDRLYVTLGYEAPVSVLHAATGEILSTIADTENTSEIVLSDGILVMRSADSLRAVKTGTQEMLWRKDTAGIRDLMLGADDGRVIDLTGAQLEAWDLETGKPLWKTKAAGAGTLVATEGVVLLKQRGQLACYDAETGKQRWTANKGIGWGPDLFVTGGLAWPGFVGHGENPEAFGFDLKTGKQKKHITAPKLISPEHHHRCYRNKATTHYMLIGYEGVEFLNLTGDNHLQHNWIRGSCRMGIIPANGMLYVPPDQCFCQPGGKFLGLAAVKATRQRPAAKQGADRLTKGTAYGKTQVSALSPQPSPNWPTYRHDAKRSGATSARVPTKLKRDWNVKLGGRLSTLTAANNKVYVAQVDAHTIHCLHAESGKTAWTYTAGGRVDSPPTIHRGMVLFGSADGHVYCVTEADGKLIWRFRAAPEDIRIGAFDQLESVWPVNGTVLVRNDIAYVAAGRSSYLDGGVRLYGLDPVTGKIIHEGRIEGPRPVEGERDQAFWVPGANAELLVSEGSSIFMRQKELTLDLKPVPDRVVSRKGEANVGLHLFSTAGLLDDSWYNRTFWMYSKRWPGFELANQSSKSGQIIVFDESQTYALRAFPVRNVHSPMFFPETHGYLLFADKNSTEPQIVGEPGAKEPVKWLPMSDYSYAKRNQMRKLNMVSFGQDKPTGYTRSEQPVWKTWVPVRVRAMVKTADALFAAGPPDVLDAKDPYAAFEGRKGGKLLALNPADGKVITEQNLDVPPVFDGLIATDGRLYMSTLDGSVTCWQ